ncbi:MAG: hypothetical protein V3S17_03505 [candidate division Zixibacteria bacterium]
MKRFTLLFTLLSLGAFMTMLPGCSTDDAVSNLIQGDTNSADFQLVQNLVGAEGLEAIGNSFDLSLDLLDSIPGATFSPKKAISRQAQGEGDEIFVFESLSYAYDGTWHVFTFAASAIDTILFDTVSISGIDSIQTVSDGMPIQVPDSTLDELRIRSRLDISVSGGFFDASSVHAITVTGITVEMLTPVTLNGTATETASGSYGDSSLTCDYSFSNSLTATNIMFAENGQIDCPTSGSVSLTATVDMTCIGDLGAGIDTVSVAGAWTATGVYASDGSVALTISDGTTVWNTNEPCDSGVQASGTSRWTHGL